MKKLVTNSLISSRPTFASSSDLSAKIFFSKISCNTPSSRCSVIGGLRFFFFTFFRAFIGTMVAGSLCSSSAPPLTSVCVSMARVSRPSRASSSMRRALRAVSARSCSASFSRSERVSCSCAARCAARAVCIFPAHAPASLTSCVRSCATKAVSARVRRMSTSRSSCCSSGGNS